MTWAEDAISDPSRVCRPVCNADTKSYCSYANIMQKVDDTLQSQRGISLLEHPHFLLLHVPDDRSKMKLVKPATDPYHRERIIQRIDKEERVLPHYALSHLWDITKTEPHLWTTIGEYVDDENGKPATPVSMRSEKRNTLIALLEKHPDSYWWIDVLCARTDTPLAIMGDIYACCALCYAMLDCDTSIIREMDIKRNQLLFSAYSSWTFKEYEETVAVLHKFTESKWWKRVWTWQEAVLPKYVILLSETLTDLSDYNMVDIRYLTSFYQNLLYSTKVPEELAGIEESPAQNHILQEVNNSRLHNGYCMHTEGKVNTPMDLLELFESFASSPRLCMDPVDYVYGVLGIFQFDIPRMNDPSQVWQLFLTELENYLADPKRVKTSDAYERALASVFTGDQARQCNLLTAANMGEVYQCLLPSVLK